MRVFKFRLAAHLGMLVSDIDARMSSRELTEWMIYYGMEPFGPAREDYRAALVSSTIANCHGNKLKPQDFIKPYERPKRDDTTSDPAKFNREQEKQMAIFKAMMGK